MRESETSAKYRKALEDSCTLTQDTLGKLREILERKSSDIDAGSVTSQEEVDRLNAIQSELVFDTVRLVQAKNAFKNDCYRTNEDSVKKVKNGDSSVSNSFLLKWEIQTFKNNQQWNALKESLERLPELRVHDIVDISRVGETDQMDVDGETGVKEKDIGQYDEFLKTLDIPLESVKSLLWSDKECEAVEKEKYLIPEDSNETLQRILAESDVKKFRLVQLHDKYYQRKISMLKEMDRKWSFEINKVRKFISSDVGKMKNELSEKLEAENKRDDEKQREAELERERLELNQVRDNESDYEGAEQDEQEQEHAESEDDQDEQDDAEIEPGEPGEPVEDGDEEEPISEDAEDVQQEEVQEVQDQDDGEEDEPDRLVQTAEMAEDAEIEE